MCAWCLLQGMPPVDVFSKFDDSLAVQSNELAKKWLTTDEPQAQASDIEGWSTPQTGTPPLPTPTRLYAWMS
jgi:hypothetical protein